MTLINKSFQENLKVLSGIEGIKNIFFNENHIFTTNKVTRKGITCNNPYYLIIISITFLHQLLFET